MRVWLALAAAVALAVPAIPQNKSADSGVIEGRVTRPGGTEGVPEVQVTLQAPAPEGDAVLLQSAYTDSDGRFSFKKLPEGQYNVSVQRDGYYGLPPAGIANISAPLQVTMSATVVPGFTPAPLAFTMARGGVISGRLRDPNGRLVPSVNIVAYQLTYRDGQAALTNVRSTQTDDRGEYRLFWMAPGSYLIAANPRRPGTVPSPQDVYARTFYPGLIDPRVVPPVIVSDGADIPSIDILIRPDAVAKISGRVVRSLGGPGGLPSATTAPAAASSAASAVTFLTTLFLIPRDSNVFAEPSPPIVQNVAANRANGRFELRNVLPGSYDLLASAGDDTGRVSWGRTRLEVGGVDIDDVIVETRAGFEIKARVIIDGEIRQPDPAPAGDGESRGAVPAPAEAAQPSMQVRLMSRAPYPTLDNVANSGMTFDPESGVLTFPNVPEGRYRFQLDPLPANAYVEDIREGAVSVFDEGLAVAGIPAGEIAVLVNTKGATVKGKVTAADQRPFDGALVALIPALPRRSNLMLYKSTQSDELGEFVINGVAPGEYRIFSWESVPANAWLNPDFMALQESRGKTVVVTAAGSAGVDLKVIPREIR